MNVTITAWPKELEAALERISDAAKREEFANEIRSGDLFTAGDTRVENGTLIVDIEGTEHLRQLLEKADKILA